jgi:hypothetical protein
MSVTFVLGATIAISAIGAAALSLLVARFGVTTSTVEPIELATRRYFCARLTYFIVGGSLALTGVLSAAALSANVGPGIAAGTIATHAPAAPALEARIHELESALADVESRLRLIPVRVESFRRPRDVAEAIHIRVTGRASAER